MTSGASYWPQSSASTEMMDDYLTQQKLTYDRAYCYFRYGTARELFHTYMSDPFEFIQGRS